MEKNWSAQQSAIFAEIAEGSGNLVVRARAGTGKTTTIIEACGRAKHEPKILLAAFNKKIAVELQSRVSAPNVEAKTLHSLGFAYIRRQWNDVKVDADVDYDRAAAACGRSAPDEMVELVRKLAAILKNAAPFTNDPEEVAGVAEDFDLIPDEDWEEEGWTTYRVAKLAVVARDAAKERDEQGRISFDDMIFIPVACNFARPWYTMVVIDEAQDMNYAQLVLAQRACKKGGRIVVVGDDRQAIYGFRGADADGIDRLKTELGAKELGLTVTYRCGKAIVERARILFLKKGVKARIEGRDVAAGLRIIVSSMKAKSVPQFIERVEGWREKQVARALKIKKQTARENKVAVVADQAEMLVAMAEGCASVAEILTRCDSLFGDSTGPSPKDAVVCSSVHRSKGLEADRVFIIADTIKDGSREEDNISYVATTRAKTRLTLVRK
jgi:superfamily I DNA/RNA helicase